MRVGIRLQQGDEAGAGLGGAVGGAERRRPMAGRQPARGRVPGKERNSATSLFLGSPAARRNAVVSPNRTSSVAKDRRPFPRDLRAPTGSIVAPRDKCRFRLRRLAADLTTLILFRSYTFYIPSTTGASSAHYDARFADNFQYAGTFVSLSYARPSCYVHSPHPLRQILRIQRR
jgi:hypothetical protein